MLDFFSKIFGTANDRIVKKLRKEVVEIGKYEDVLSQLTDSELSVKTHFFKERLSSGASLDDICYEAFAVVREASKRVLGMRHFDVQMIGGLILHRGNISEMRTGEGKTLVATLPVYLNALTGKGVHVVTVSDYLVRRDAAWMGRIYDFLGLSVGYVIPGMGDDERRVAYAADITYATNNELGFDYLRDNMKYDFSSRVQRGCNYAIVDEVDSILIDEARTPLIISGPVDDNSVLYVVINDLIKKLDASCYEKDEKSRVINPTEEGINSIEKHLRQAQLIQPNTTLFDLENMHLVHFINQALKAQHMFAKDVDYIVRNGKVVIIDEFTGRIMDGRRYSDGLHQAIEAKESVKVQNENQTLASVTFQNYFRLYNKICGMTGTAMTEAGELKDIYDLDVISVPTHHPIKRIDCDDEIYGTKKEKYDAIALLIQSCYEKGQPVLVGTVSIEKSEEISSLLKQKNIPHNVLNAKFHEQEAYIIAQAGRFKAVTIATNMAGRGTDIMLGGNVEMLITQIDRNLYEHEINAKIQMIKASVAIEKDQVIAAGGLYVVGTERHESRRIDNQLRGRSARQGDPGTTKFFLSLEDDLMRIFAQDKVANILRNLALKDGEALHSPLLNRTLEFAQNKIEMSNYEMRKNLLKFDNVMNDQRKVIYEQRDDIIQASSFLPTIFDLSDSILHQIISTAIPENSFREQWDLDLLAKELHRMFNINVNIENLISLDGAESEIREKLRSMIQELFNNKAEDYSLAIFNDAAKYVFLSAVDSIWKDHLHTLDHLRHGISLRAYGQKDPLNEYKREAFLLFEKMLDRISDTFVQSMAHLHIEKRTDNPMRKPRKENRSMRETREDPALAKYASASSNIETIAEIPAYVDSSQRNQNDESTWGKISRNEPCPCGSGKKYKYCHGAKSK